MKQNRSFYQPLVRYVPTVRRDPREDSLTQCFLSLLLAEQRFESKTDQSGVGLLQSVLKQWGVLSEGDRPLIRTQRRVRAPGRPLRIDLAIEWSSTRVVWVEIKHGAELSGEDQLSRYCDELERRYADSESKVVFLPPLGYGPVDRETGPLQDRLVASDWQVTGAAIDSWLMDETEVDSRLRWLTEEFLLFLDEEGLYMPEALDSTVLDELEVAKTATRIISSVLSDADDQISNFAESEDWIKDDYKRSKAKWPSFWSVVGINDGTNRFHDCWLEWSLAEYVEGNDGPTFCAGLTLGKSRKLDEFREKTGQEGDIVLEEFNTGGYGRIFRVMSVKRFVETSPADRAGQVEALAAWVREAWETVAKSP